ncbi:MAG: hypothetical protein WC789_09190 [Lentisphaeria bacterium]
MGEEDVLEAVRAAQRELVAERKRADEWCLRFWSVLVGFVVLAGVGLWIVHQTDVVSRRRCEVCRKLEPKPEALWICPECRPKLEKGGGS